MNWSKGSDLEQAGRLEQAGSKRKQEEARGVSWGLSKAPGKFQGPRYAQGARGASWEQGE